MTRTVECHSCGRVMQYQPAMNTQEENNAGHSTIINANKQPNELQCACGKYL